MKNRRLKTLALLFACTALAGCASRTDYGACIGAFDDPDPELKYATSARNVILAIVFSETLVVPAYIVLEETRCPVALKVPPLEEAP